MKIPQTSSMTIQPGSSVPVSFIALFTNGIAAKKMIRAAKIKNRFIDRNESPKKPLMLKSYDFNGLFCAKMANG